MVFFLNKLCINEKTNGLKYMGLMSKSVKKSLLINEMCGMQSLVLKLKY